MMTFDRHQLSPNPFRPGMGLEPTYLADRAPQLARFKHYLAGFPGLPRNVRVTGLRGVGKTVLLQQYGRLAEEAGWIVVGRECNEHLQEESIFGQALVEDCRRAVEQSSRALAIRQRSQAVARQALDLLGSFTISLAGVTVAVQPRTQPLRIPLFEEQLFTSLRLACASVSAAGRPGVLLSWDEAHVLRDSANHRQFPLGLFLAVLARAQREGMPVMLVLCGLPTLTDNLTRAKSYSERMFQAEELGQLRPPEDLLAFTRPLELTGRKFDVEMAQAVLRVTGAYAFHIQFVGALLWDAVEWPLRISKVDFDQHRPTILEALDGAFFEARLARTSGTERSLLRAMAASGESAQIHDVLKLTRLPNQTAQQLIARLRDKGLIYRPQRGHLAFTVPLFGDYMRRVSRVASRGSV
jgi:AAA ATPase domain